MPVTITDPFETNDKKVAIQDRILAEITTRFPGSQPCGSVKTGEKHLYYKGYPTDFIGERYHYYQGHPTIVRSDNDIISIRFGVLTPTPPDTRKKVLGHPVGDPPLPQVIGAVHLFFEKTQAILTETKISVFGLEHKETFTRLVYHINGLYAGKVSLVVESRLPLYL